MPFVESDGARLFWDVEGEGTPILLIMGHRFSSRMWYPLLPALTRRHRVILFDNRGTGQSDSAREMTIEQLADDALAVLTAAGESSAHVYGVSMGGGIAAEFGMRYPERTRSLTLGCTLLKTEKSNVSPLQRLFFKLPYFILRALTSQKRTPESYGSAAPREKALHDIEMVKRDRHTMEGAKAQAFAIVNYATSRERAASTLTMPVLVLHGDEDSVVPVEAGRALAQAIPGSEYVEFKGAGHNYVVACYEQSTAAFVDFIARADRAVDAQT